MPAFVDHTGRAFGRWTVVRRAENNRHNQPQWLCRCVCGVEKVVSAGGLVSGRSGSCGCLNREIVGRVCVERNRTHGQAGTPTYRTWQNMLARCENPKSTGFHKYGAKGVAVCLRWRRSFEAFRADMGERPVGMTLDRIDPLGNYEPGNCRWATQETQQNNRSNNRRLEHAGLCMTMAQWSRHLGLSKNAIANRLDTGLPLAEALSSRKRSRWVSRTREETHHA